LWISTAEAFDCAVIWNAHVGFNVKADTTKNTKASIASRAVFLRGEFLSMGGSQRTVFGIDAPCWSAPADYASAMRESS
jgi:hypothetical protein